MSEYSTVKIPGICKITGADFYLFRVGSVVDAMVDGVTYKAVGAISRYTQTGPSKSLRRARAQIKKMLREAAE